jgi:hypothetical protein
MQKKRFNQKKILGILKTYHAKKRQVERNITDLQLTKILQDGEYEDRSEHEVVMTLDGYHIYLSHDLEKIITVTAPDKQAVTPKMISNHQGKQIKKEIIDVSLPDSTDEIKEMSFDDYMKTKFK